MIEKKAIKLMDLFNVIQKELIFLFMQNIRQMLCFVAIKIIFNHNLYAY